MKLPYSWLKELVSALPSPEEVASILTMRGFEIEEISSPGDAIRDVVTAKISAMEPHPNADKLTLCQVTDGTSDYSIICGAKNMKAGDCVALARIGVVLPGDFKIEKRKLRGVASEGMLCSLRELQLGDDHEGIMILPQETPLGERLIDVIGLNEVVFDINVTPNRPDALCAVGIARELAAACGGTLNLPDCSPLEPGIEPGFTPSITLQADDLCPRYTGLVLRDIKIGPSPDWLKARLEACDIRSINNVVDCTNLVLLEQGQPLHAFDLDTLHERRIIVRRAQANETMKTLDEEERTFDDDILLIADADRGIAVAGVMGGLDTEVSSRTTSLLLESAYFHPPSIRRTSKKLTLSSEASYRFERGVDLETVIPASYRCARLLVELAGAKVVGRMGIADTPHKEKLERLRERTVPLQFEYCNRLLGQTISPDSMEEIFLSLGFKITGKDDLMMNVRVPSYRQDITRQADLVEEIARCVGYNEFTPTLPTTPIKPPEQQIIDRHLVQTLRHFLIGEGFYETVTYSFTDPEALRKFPLEQADLANDLVNIQNPINVQEATMRTSLFPSLLQAIRRNKAHGNNDFGLFEMARTYHAQNETWEEKYIVAAMLVGNPHKNWRNQKSELDFFDFKGLMDSILQGAGVTRFRLMPGPECLHPKRGMQIQVGKKQVGFFGELHPSIADSYELSEPIFLFELDLCALTDIYRNHVPAYKAYSAFPSVKRDFALLLPQGITFRQVGDLIRKQCGDLLEELEIFDYYKGKQVAKGKVSAGFRITLRSKQETLKEEVVDAVSKEILMKLEKELDVTLRS